MEVYNTYRSSGVKGRAIRRVIGRWDFFNLQEFVLSPLTLQDFFSGRGGGWGGGGIGEKNVLLPQS